MHKNEKGSCKVTVFDKFDKFEEWEGRLRVFKRLKGRLFFIVKYPNLWRSCHLCCLDCSDSLKKKTNFHERSFCHGKLLHVMVYLKVKVHFADQMIKSPKANNSFLVLRST